jgi:pyruvate dehydrogenase E1 component alpha subunit
MVWKLPVIFVVEDNGFAEATSSEYAVAGDICARAAAFGMPAEKVDGLDFFAVHEAAKRAIERGRGGHGPTFLHIVLPRYYGHFSGDADSYRTAEEKQAMRRDKDCLKFFRRKVTDAGLLDASELDGIDKEVEAMIEQAVRAARAAVMPDPQQLSTDVYLRYS